MPDPTPSSPEPENGEVEYGLVMPFVVCSSEGGPLDDHAFVCGVRFGDIAYRLGHERPETLEEYVESDMVPQYDLLAMKEAYALTTDPWEERPDEWTRAEFVRLQDKSNA